MDNYEIKQELLEQICSSTLPKEQQITAMQTVFEAYDEHKRLTGSLALVEEDYYERMKQRQEYMKGKLYEKFPELKH